MGILANRQNTTASAVQLPSRKLFPGITITALSTNTANVCVGDFDVTTATGYPLEPGQSISYTTQDLSDIWIIGTNTTDSVAFTGN
jgi:hypothetical protein